MRIERVVLEHHRDIAVLRGNVVDDRAIDGDLAAGDLFKTGDHSQCRRFSAARRAYEAHEFLVFNFDIGVIYRHHLFIVHLADIFKNYFGHCVLLPLVSHLGIDSQCYKSISITNKLQNFYAALHYNAIIPRTTVMGRADINRLEARFVV